MTNPDYRSAIAAYIRTQALPPDKFSHQPRLYKIAAALGAGRPFDDDVVYGATWMHDIGVFVGHRPETLPELARWDHLAYAMRVTPDLLRRFGFPVEKIAPVLEAIRTHMPSGQPTTYEATLVREADILEQLGAVGMLRTISKVGRDTRFPTFREAVETIRRCYTQLPNGLSLPQARVMAEPRLAAMAAFLKAAEAEYEGGEP